MFCETATGVRPEGAKDDFLYQGSTRQRTSTAAAAAAICSSRDGSERRVRAAVGTPSILMAAASVDRDVLDLRAGRRAALQPVEVPVDDRPQGEQQLAHR